jgi:serine/threonine protein kinase
LECEGTASFVAREEGPVGFRRDVVLKVVPEADPLTALAAQGFAEEATIGSRLNHPNIVRTHGLFAESGRLALVVEHVDGTTLAQLLALLRIRQERLSDPAALYIGVSVLEALAHAHGQMDEAGVKRPIVHQRVDPSHVALGRDGSVKLGGFSALVAPSEPTIATNDATVAPPAVATTQGEKADVRAAGLLLWGMLTGRDAAAGLEPLSTLRSDLPRELSAAVGAAIDVANAKRAVGCAEVASWIKKVARLAGGRDELRARVMMVAPAAEPREEPPDASDDSAQVPLSGWSVRLAPLASRVLAVDALLRQHRRASLGVAGGMVVALLLTVAHALSGARRDGAADPPRTAALEARTLVVPGAPPPPTYSSAAATEIVAPLAIPATTRAAARAGTSPPYKTPTPLAPDQVEHAVPVAAAKSAALPPKGFGYLTVHSSIGYAYVYVQLFRYGHVERRLTVRCGKRFLSLGVPKPSGREPTWFAPSQTVDIPCGGAIEIAMMPKWIP